MISSESLNYRKNPFKNNNSENKIFGNSKFKKIGALSIILIFASICFMNTPAVSNASAQSVLSIAKGGTNANNAESAQKNLGRTDAIDCNSTDNQFPSSKAVYNFIEKSIAPDFSMDNTSFSNEYTNWAGGDLIIKKNCLSSTAGNNKIKIDDVDCTTSGQGYTANSAADDSIPQMGCVLPAMSAGSHTVKISTDGGVNYQNYGSITYSEKPTLAGCDTTSMQTFGANGAVCKAAMKQGQVIVLNDPRGNSDSPNGQKYRVKKMPDGNVWMIDNLKLGSTTSTTALTPADTNISSNYTLPTINTTNNNADPGGTEYCSSTGTVWTLVSGSLTGCGYMYNWNTLMAETISESGFSISPKGWNIAKSATGITYSALSEAMAEKASNAAGKRNPVYNTTAWRNFEGINTPWQSFRAGNYRGGNPTLQGSHGYWASQTEQPSPNEIYIFLLCLWYNGVGPNDQNVNLKTNGTSVRSVL